MGIALATPNLRSAVAAEQVRLQIPSRPDWIAPAIEYLKHRALLSGVCQEAQASRVMLALHEGLTNAVVHGNLELSSELKERDDNSFAEALAARSADPFFSSRKVEIDVEYDGTCCQWVFTDQGKGFDVDRILGRQESDEPLLASGRGILMMRAFMDDMRYESGGRRLILTLGRPAAQEQRGQPRVPVQERVRVAPRADDGSVDWEGAYEGVARDLSPEGMALVQSRLAATDRIVIGIYSEGQSIYVPAEVRHCRSVGPDAVELGCRFEPQAEAPAAGKDQGSLEAVNNALGALIQRHRRQQPREDDRRAYPRAAYTARIGIIETPGAEPKEGFARDLSRNGIAFITTAPLSPGVLVLSLSQGADGTALRVRAQVVRCNRVVDGFYDVGAKFLALEKDA